MGDWNIGRRTAAGKTIVDIASPHAWQGGYPLSEVRIATLQPMTEEDASPM